MEIKILRRVHRRESAPDTLVDFHTGEGNTHAWGRLETWKEATWDPKHGRPYPNAQIVANTREWRVDPVDGRILLDAEELGRPKYPHLVRWLNAGAKWYGLTELIHLDEASLMRRAERDARGAGGAGRAVGGANGLLSEVCAASHVACRKSMYAALYLGTKAAD